MRRLPKETFLFLGKLPQSARLHCVVLVMTFVSLEQTRKQCDIVIDPQSPKRVSRVDAKLKELL